MAGYLFIIGGSQNEKEEDRRARIMDVVSRGVYSTMMSASWSSAAEGTLGDFVTMRPGDNVYFFGKRKVYGIGAVLDAGGGRAVTENFRGATLPKIDVEYASVNAIVKGGAGKVGRWVVAFGPSPMFFDEGIDMDDLLLSDPDAFRSLRVMQQRSFVKLDDEENRAFMAAFLRRNIATLGKAVERVVQVPSEIAAGVAPDVRGLLASKRKRDGSLSSEMLVEVGLLSQLSGADPVTTEVFGGWDYLSHQVNASPFKPVAYMDRIDVFGYRWIMGYDGIPERFLVAELKKDVSGAADVPQVMKYVDWVRSEYVHGDYSMVKAFHVAHRFEDGITGEFGNLARRDYVVGCRPAVSRSWSDLTLVTYDVRPDGYVEFCRYGA